MMTSALGKYNVFSATVAEFDQQWSEAFLYRCAAIEAYASGNNFIDMYNNALDGKRLHMAFRNGDGAKRDELFSELSGMWNLLIQYSEPFLPPSKPESEINSKKPIKRKDSEFSFPNKISRQDKFNLNRKLATTLISNKFAYLANDNEDNSMDQTCEEEDSPQPQGSPPITKEPRVEPITVKRTEDFNEIMFKLENEIVKDNLKKIDKGDSVKLYPATIDQYRKIQQYLTETKLEYFAMLPKNERSKKVLLKGIPPDTKIEDVKSELTRKYFQIHRVSQLKNCKTKQYMPLFLVDIFPTEDW